MITIAMGKPGAGKSTYLAKLAKDNIKKGRKVYSNVYIKGTHQLNIKELGKYQIEDALVIIDEAGHEFNARDFKKFTAELYRFFTIHRHYALDIVLAVQFWDRLDIVIRELTQRIVVVKPTLFKFIAIKIKEISVKIDISEDKKIVENYAWMPFSTRYYLKRPLWSLFDSFYLDELPSKEYPVWIGTHEIIRETMVTKTRNKINKKLDSIKLSLWKNKKLRKYLLKYLRYKKLKEREELIQ